MTAPSLLAASTERLAAAACSCGHPVAEWHHSTRGCTYLGAGPNQCPCEHNWADALLASGVVVPAASLPDDEWPTDDDHSWRAVAKRWECLYREAAGLPVSEHTRRRLESMAQRAEEAYQRGRADALAAALEDR